MALRAGDDVAGRGRLDAAALLGAAPEGHPGERLDSREIAALVRELRGTLLAPPARAAR